MAGYRPESMRWVGAVCSFCVISRRDRALSPRTIVVSPSHTRSWKSSSAGVEQTTSERHSPHEAVRDERARGADAQASV